MTVIGNPVDPKDPWVLSQSGYEKAKFYTRSSDGHGHADNVQVKLSPHFHAQLCDFLRKNQLPLNSVQDVVRDALIHRLHDYADMILDPEAEAELRGMVETEAGLADMDRRKVAREKWLTFIASLNDELGQLITDREFDEAADVIENYRDNQEMSLAYVVKLQLMLDQHSATIRHLSPRIARVV